MRLYQSAEINYVQSIIKSSKRILALKLFSSVVSEKTESHLWGIPSILYIFFLV